MRLLADRGFRGVTFHEAVLRPPGPKTLAITFDDAYRSVIELALPIISRVGFVATVFAPTAFVGTEEPMAWPGIDHWRDTEHAGELMPMSWEELQRLAEAGWEIGSHTRSHPRLPTLDDDALERRAGESRRDIERHLGGRARLSPIRMGTTTLASSRRPRQAGYEAAGTLPARLTRAHRASGLASDRRHSRRRPAPFPLEGLTRRPQGQGDRGVEPAARGAAAASLTAQSALDPDADCA